MSYSTKNLALSYDTNNSKKDNSNDNTNRGHAQVIVSSAPPPSSSSFRSAASPLSGNERLDSYKGRFHNLSPDEEIDPTKKNNPELLIPLLANQVYHLPGNNWWEDWFQYMANNHPIFGICCHHTLHPLKTYTRIIALLGSIVFGVAITNFFYLLFLYNNSLDQPVVTIMIPNSDGSSSSSSSSDVDATTSTTTPSTTSTDLDVVTSSSSGYTLTTGMLLLWTVGGGIHTTYNLLVWHVAACACCRPGGCFERFGCACCPNLGKRMVRVLVLIALALAILIILLRVAIAEQQDAQQQEQQYYDEYDFDDDRHHNWYNSSSANITTTSSSSTTGPEHDDDIDPSGGGGGGGGGIYESMSSINSLKKNTGDTLHAVQDDVHELDFVWGYCIEMILAMFLYYPLGGTILFSGILGCGGKIPLLGGRPREMLLEQQARDKQQQRQQRNSKRRPPPRTTNPSTAATRTTTAMRHCHSCGGTTTTTSISPSTTSRTASLRSLSHLEQGQITRLPQQDDFYDDDHDDGQPYHEDIEIVWSRQAQREFQE